MRYSVEVRWRLFESIRGLECIRGLEYFGAFIYIIINKLLELSFLSLLIDLVL